MPANQNQNQTESAEEYGAAAYRWIEPADDDTERPKPLTPQDLDEAYRGADREGALLETGSIFERLTTPKARALIIDVLVADRGEAWTAAELAERREDLSVTSFNRHKDALVDLGVMLERGKRGNAMTYSLNTGHPLAQVLVMFDDVANWGRTQVHLDEQFIDDDADEGGS